MKERISGVVNAFTHVLKVTGQIKTRILVYHVTQAPHPLTVVRIALQAGMISALVAMNIITSIKEHVYFNVRKDFGPTSSQSVNLAG